MSVPVVQVEHVVKAAEEVLGTKVFTPTVKASLVKRLEELAVQGINDVEAFLTALKERFGQGQISPNLENQIKAKASTIATAETSVTPAVIQDSVNLTPPAV